MNFSLTKCCLQTKVVRTQLGLYISSFPLFELCQAEILVQYLVLHKLMLDFLYRDIEPIYWLMQAVTSHKTHSTNRLKIKANPSVKDKWKTIGLQSIGSYEALVSVVVLIARSRWKYGFAWQEKSHIQRNLSQGVSIISHLLQYTLGSLCFICPFTEVLLFKRHVLKQTVSNI